MDRQLADHSVPLVAGYSGRRPLYAEGAVSQVICRCWSTQPIVGNNKCLELDSVVLTCRCTTPGAVCVRARFIVARGDTIGRPDMKSKIASLAVVLGKLCWLSFTVMLWLFVAVCLFSAVTLSQSLLSLKVQGLVQTSCLSHS